MKQRPMRQPSMRPPAPGDGDAGSAAARAFLRERGTVPPGALPALIETSWQRCLAYGLNGDQRRAIDPLERQRLGEQLEQHAALLRHARPVMDVLFGQIVDTQNVVVLASDAGYVLHRLGDADFLARTERVALAPGAEWSESCRGTNAIGTALAVGAPVVVHGEQHFLAAHHFLTCSAAPILDPYGRLGGVLDVTGDRRGFTPHTMALVRMSVQMIENRMFADAFGEALILRFHTRPELIGTLNEGLVAFSEDGRLLSATRNACLQFGQGLESLREARFAALFGLPLERLFDHLMARPRDPIALTLGNGARVQARVDFRPPRPRRHAPPLVAATPAMAPASAADGAPSCPLARLQTGDAQVDAVMRKVRKVIGHDIPILIQGETGTGKERLANAIHQAGLRAGKAFVAVNCAAIPEGLIESELFGYEEGAFTGARRRGSPGRLLQANGGTLFLDEIGDMPLPLQARLLRVLQERVVVPLGSVKSTPVDIAVICATHQRIRELVAAGRFREDLYFRLNGLTVVLPPLRARSDLASLVAALLHELGGQFGRPAPPRLDPEVFALFRRHPWPGNLRQLANLLRTAVVMAEGDEVIRREHLPDDFIEDIVLGQSVGDGVPPAGHAGHAVPPAPTFAAPAFVTPVTAPFTTSLPAAPAEGIGRLRAVAVQAMREALARNNGNISAAARELGVSRNTLYRKLNPS